MVWVDDQRICEAIAHAAVAGGCRIWAKLDETTARGLERCADRHSALAGEKLDEWVRVMGTGIPSPADFEFPDWFLD